MAQPWPISLQELLSEANFGMKFGDTAGRSDNDLGPQKVRRRYTKPVDTITGAIYLTIAEYSTFYAFYNTTLNGGVLPFTFDHPITSLPTDFRFKGTPEISSIGGANFTVQFEWEVLPS